VHRKIFIEADFFEYHGGRDEFQRDISRTSELTSCGWRVLRVTWVQMMNEPGKVYQLMLRMVREAD
jgi:very-short-patch-repair endonuclease